jgi:hypothetical protein
MTAGVLAPAAECPPADQALQAMVRRLANGLEARGTACPATGRELQVMTARALVLEAALIPGPVMRIRLAIGLMLGGWVTTTRARADALLNTYAEVCEPLPAWAVERGCLLLMRGQVSGVHPDFVPSSARVYATSREQVIPYRAELELLRRIARAAQWQTASF